MHGVILSRLLIGLTQGALLYLLARAQLAKTWPATDLPIYNALSQIGHYVPIFAIVTIGNMRPRTGVTWIAVLTAMAGGLGFYSGFRDPNPPADALFARHIWFAHYGLSILFFVSHCLVAAGDADRRRIATFATYFDVAWRLATQFLLSSLFVLLLWGILFLGATLFAAIGIRFFLETLTKLWFMMPVTAVASSAALHLTDTRTGLVRGARDLVLGLLSWLMPIMTVIAVGFLVALPFTGLQPLWKTRYATGCLLAAAAILVLLINSHFQDGRPGARHFRLLTVTRVPAALVLLPLTALAVFGLLLRVEQYGWTPARVIVAAMLVLTLCHASGYAMAALSSGPSLRLLPATNIASAFVLVLGLLALLTPIADPARVAVASQVARLEAGKIDPDKFDFNFLQYQSARFGTEALERLKNLKDGPNAARIAERANRPQISPRAPATTPSPPATPESRTANITAVPAGTTVPADFLRQDWAASADKARLPPCLTQTTTQKCEAVVLDLTGEPGSGMIVVGSSQIAVLVRDAQGKWSLLGPLGNTYCAGVRDALRAGRVDAVTPRYKEIEVNGARLPLMLPCPPVPR